MAYSILVPYDFDGSSDAALAWAAGLLAAAGGSLTVLHVVRAPPPIAALDLASLEYPSDEERRAMTARLAAAAARHGAPGAHARVVVAPAIGPAVVDAARGAGAGLIALGTHGGSPLVRAFVGSVADYVIRHAECPVATIRAAAG